MLKDDKCLLVKQPLKLTTLGIAVEKERKNLRKLVARRVSYDDPKMIQAYNRFVKVDSEWKQLESKHLQLRKKLGMAPF